MGCVKRALAINSSVMLTSAKTVRARVQHVALTISAIDVLRVLV